MPDFSYEISAVNNGYSFVCGVDEAGRGPLAGPVCAAAVVLDPNVEIPGINDSKKLSEKKREALYDKIIEKAICYTICEIQADEIDEINILQATKKCMKNCIETLSVTPDCVLIDAVKLDVNVKTVPIIKGDLKSYSIGAASILAKVYRDRLMEEYSQKYVGYGFERNSGYGTKEHIQKIKEIGPCSIHRKTFIKNFLEVKASD